MEIKTKFNINRDGIQYTEECVENVINNYQENVKKNKEKLNSENTEFDYGHNITHINYDK